MSTTPPPIITGPGSYRTREGKRVEAKLIVETQWKVARGDEAYPGCEFQEAIAAQVASAILAKFHVAKKDAP